MAQKWKCPDCGALNKVGEGEKVCFECDAEILSNDELEMVDDGETSVDSPNTTPVPNTSDDEGEIIEEVVEGYWICPKCETKNKGSKQGCSACGAVRDENVEFFCDDDAPVITDEKEIEAAMAGPDWICEFCGNTSPASAKNCTGCGSPREGAKKRKETEETFGDTKSSSKKDPKPKTVKTPVPAKPLPLAAKIGCGIFALLFLIFISLACSESKTKVQITASSWALEIDTETYQTCTETAWKSELPTAAKQISSSREIRRYNKVADGKEMVTENYTVKVKTGTKKVKTGRVNKGNGRFVNKYKNVAVYKTENKTRRVSRTRYKQVPVYEMKIKFTIDRWKSSKTFKASGTNSLPVWPKVIFAKNTPTKIGDMRQKDKREKYSITVKELGKKEAHKLDKIRSVTITSAQFIKMKVGSEWDAVINGLGQIVEIDLKDGKKKTKK